MKAALRDPNTPMRITVIAAAAAMIGATFAPFATQGCVMCPLDYVIPSRSVFQGLDGWIALAVVIALALFAIAALVDSRHRIASAIGSVVLSAAALALGLLEGIDAGGRVIGWDAMGTPMQLGPHRPIPYVPEKVSYPPVHLDSGFFLFVAAAVVAFAAALVLVQTARGRALRMEQRAHLSAGNSLP
jgi:hypothetical protein